MLRTDTAREEKGQDRKAGCKIILREAREADREQGGSHGLVNNAQIQDLF